MLGSARAASCWNVNCLLNWVAGLISDFTVTVDGNLGCLFIRHRHVSMKFDFR